MKWVNEWKKHASFLYWQEVQQAKLELVKLLENNQSNFEQGLYKHFWAAEYFACVALPDFCGL